MDFFFQVADETAEKLEIKCNFLGDDIVTNKSQLVTHKLRIKNYFNLLIQKLPDRSKNNSLVLKIETTFQNQENITIF